MIVLTVDRLGFSVGADDILDGVTFSLNEGEKLGIVGVNGAGKSTLLKMIAGQMQPSAGAVYLKKGATVALLRQNETVEADTSPYEEIMKAFEGLANDEKRLEELSAAMRDGSLEAQRSYHALHERFIENGGYEYKSRIKGVLRSLGFANDGMTCEKLSGGQKTRLALARVLLSDADILLLDEPTNHLDTQTLAWLEDDLKNFKKTLIVVSHDRYFLDRVTSRTLDIERGKAKLYNGSYSVFAEKKKKDREIAERHYVNQQREIKRIEEYIALQKRWNRERNIIAAESRQKMLDKMEKLDRPQGEEKSIRLSFSAGYESGEDVLKVRDLSKAFGERKLFENLNFEIKKGDRFFVIGHNGCGKSTLMKILMQRLQPDKGVCAYGYNVTIGYYDQENLNLLPSNTVLDELWNTDPNRTETRVRSALALFRFTGDDVSKNVAVLSGGERARLTFSKLVLKQNNLLLLDEPTNHLDLASKEVLEDALSDYDGTLICVSHDRYFISKLATRILDFDGPRGFPVVFDGRYEEYLRYRSLCRDDAEQPPEEQMISENKKTYLENKKAAAELRKARARLEKDEQRARAIEERLTEISGLEEENATDYIALDALQKEKDAAESELLALYEEIEELKASLPQE